MQTFTKAMKGWLWLFTVIFLTGCATKVTRVEVEEKIDLSGQWNDYDAMLVAKDMIIDSLQKPWLMDFVKNEGRNPVVIVGNVRNQSMEHINTDIFIEYLERELLNSGKIVFVASPTERKQLRDERQDQQEGFTAEETMAKIGRERGADYMLIGSVNSVKDEVKGKYAVLYQVSLDLVDLETNQKVWIGQKQIKKLVERAKYSM